MKIINYAKIQDFLLMFLLAALPIAHFPYGEDPFRPMRWALFQEVTKIIIGLIILRLYRSRAELWAKKISPSRHIKVLFGLFATSAFFYGLSNFINATSWRFDATFVGYCMGGILFFAFYDSFSRIGVRRFIRIFSIIIFINAMYGVMQFLGWDPLFLPLDPGNVYRPHLVGGFMDSPNMLAPLLASFVPYMFCLWMTADTRKNFILYGFGLLLLLAPIGMTKNIAGWVALVAVMLALLIYFSIHEYRQRGGKVLRLTACWIAVALAVSGGAASYLRAGEAVKIMKIRSTNERITQNRAALMMFGEAPLLGRGPGSFSRNFVEYRRAVWFAHPPYRLPDRAAHQVHNDYAQLLAEGGILTVAPLAIILIYFLGSQLALMKKNLNMRKLSERGIIAIGAGSGFWVIAVNALGNFPFYIAPLAVTAIFWAAIAYQTAQKP